MIDSCEHSMGHWLDRYANGYHRWRRIPTETRGEVFARPLGLIETAFDHDGSDFEGRADVNMTPTCLIETQLSRDRIRAHILHAWAALRASHALLRAHVEHGKDSGLLKNAGLHDKCFVIEVPHGDEALLNEARRTIVFLDEHYEEVDPNLFLRHAMNTARCIEASRELGRLFILPLEPQGENRFILRTLIVCAHQILDGASIFAWTSHVVNLLNRDDAKLHVIYSAKNANQLWKSLPPAQEDVYPQIHGPKARQRWFWAISRILRYCRRSLPPAFANPLKRSKPWPSARAELPVFDKVLNYDIVPPLNSYISRFELSSSVTTTLQRLCREARTSIGAGGFALVAASMMELYEERFPDVPLEDRRGFIATFPVDPRPFLYHKAPPDSMMLAFSDGIYLPFLPSHLPIEGRFKLLVKCAHRQLRVFQKGSRHFEGKGRIGSRSPAQLLPSLYTAFLERVESWKPDSEARFNPQGAYPANFGQAGAGTCGISSVGVVKSTFEAVPDEHSAFQVIDLISRGGNVRVRDNEFLCGIMSESNRTYFSVALDGNAIDESRAEQWVEKMKYLLAPSANSKL